MIYFNKMTKEKISKEQVLHIADLCNLTLTGEEMDKLSEMLTDTIDYIKILDELDTSEIKETYQVAGKTNVFQSENDKNTTLSQSESLLNAKKVIKDMFSTKGVFDR